MLDAKCQGASYWTMTNQVHPVEESQPSLTVHPVGAWDFFRIHEADRCWHAILTFCQLFPVNERRPQKKNSSDTMLKFFTLGCWRDIRFHVNFWCDICLIYFLLMMRAYGTVSKVIRKNAWKCNCWTPQWNSCRVAMRREPSAFTWLRRNLTETVTPRGRLRPNLHRLDVTWRMSWPPKLSIHVYPACCARCAAKLKKTHAYYSVAKTRSAFLHSIRQNNQNDSTIV